MPRVVDQKNRWRSIIMKIPLKKIAGVSEDYYVRTRSISFPKQPPIELENEFPIIIRYTPCLPVDEDKNLMLKVLRKYIPAKVNQGLIPVDIDERKKMYPKAFKELAKYMISKPDNF